MIELLKRLSELQPDRCRHYDDDLSEDFTLKRGEGFITVWAVGLGDISTCGLDTIQGAMQETIAAHPAKLRLRLENATERWYATLLDAEGTCLSEADSEAAIAVLRVYVSYLDLHTDDEALMADAVEGGGA